MAKYTFTEQCQEVEGLELEDGTTKIFLNMSSKNSFKKLIRFVLPSIGMMIFTSIYAAEVLALVVTGFFLIKFKNRYHYF